MVARFANVVLWLCCLFGAVLFVAIWRESHGIAVFVVLACAAVGWTFRYVLTGR